MNITRNYWTSAELNVARLVLLECRERHFVAVKQCWLVAVTDTTTDSYTGWPKSEATFLDFD